MSIEKLPALVTLETAVAETGLPLYVLRRAIYAGQLPATKPTNGRVYLTREAVAAWLAAQATRPAKDRLPKTAPEAQTR